MDYFCIGIYRAERLDESYREILRKYQAFIKEDTQMFSIELEWHMESTYTKHETKMLTNVFGCFPKQVIWNFGSADRIVIAAQEIIRYLGGLLKGKYSYDRAVINSYPGVKYEIMKKNYREPLKHQPDYWLVDHDFIKPYYDFIDRNCYSKFQLGPFLPGA